MAASKLSLGRTRQVALESRIVRRTPRSPRLVMMSLRCHRNSCGASYTWSKLVFIDCRRSRPSTTPMKQVVLKSSHEVRPQLSIFRDPTGKVVFGVLQRVFGFMRRNPRRPYTGRVEHLLTKPEPSWCVDRNDRSRLAAWTQRPDREVPARRAARHFSALIPFVWAPANVWRR